MTKITIETQDPQLKLQAEFCEDSTVSDVFEIFHGMLISLGYQMGSIENVIKELAEEIKD